MLCFEKGLIMFALHYMRLSKNKSFRQLSTMSRIIELIVLFLSNSR